MNHILLIGRLTRDPELRFLPTGVAVATFDLAVDRPKSKQGETGTDFIRIVTWNKLAENCANYLKKGRQAAVEGRLQIRNYTAKDGQKRYVTEVVANEVQFLGGNREGQAQPAQSIGGVNLDDLPF